MKSKNQKHVVSFSGKIDSLEERFLCIDRIMASGSNLLPQLNFHLECGHIEGKDLEIFRQAKSFYGGGEKLWLVLQLHLQAWKQRDL